MLLNSKGCEHCYFCNKCSGVEPCSNYFPVDEYAEYVAVDELIETRRTEFYDEWNTYIKYFYF